MTRERSRQAKEAVRTSYDKMAEKYELHSTMQSGNSSHLARLVESSTTETDVRAVLDLGCGDGQWFRGPHGDWSPGALMVGVDISEEIVRIGNDGSSGAAFVVGDADSLPFASSSFDLTVANSVLHWLNAAELDLSPNQAVAEVARVLNPGGLVCASIAGQGTARSFQQAYADVAERYRREGLIDDRLFRPDPIGCMSLDEVVDLFRSAELVILEAWLAYEPVSYDGAGSYAADVAAYGFGPYTHAVKDSLREQFFDDLTAHFKACQGEGPYMHDQYMVYVAARRPS